MQREQEGWIDMHAGMEPKGGPNLFKPVNKVLYTKLFMNNLT